MKCNASFGGLYGLGIIGAVVYFVTHADSFLDGLIGVGLSIFWPSVIVYKVLEIFKM